MGNGVYEWLLLVVVFTLITVIDFLVVGKKHKEGEHGWSAIKWAILWIFLGLSFTLYIFITRGTTLAMEYISAYFVEESLSIDNLFAFMMIFRMTGVSEKHQYRLLVVGITLSILLRFVAFVGGYALIAKFKFMYYIMGGVLILTAIKFLYNAIKEDTGEKQKEVGTLKFLSKIFRIHPSYQVEKWIIKEGGKLYLTSGSVAFLGIFIMDVVFAIDSVPAVIGITKDLFVAVSSNVFALIGLRSLYFAITSVMKKIEYLDYGLSVILAFIGVKLILHEHIHISTVVSLGVILSIIMISAILSMIIKPSK